MNQMDDGRLDVSEDTLELSLAKRTVAFERACRIANIDPETPEEAMENEVFVKEFSDQLVQMLIADDMATFRGMGLIEIDGVNPDGTVRHVLTAEGEAQFG
jgi:hypothetical protein